MTPWKVRVDWTCRDAGYNRGIEVELLVMDEEPRLLRTFDSDTFALDWAIKYVGDRGFDFRCTVPPKGVKHLTLHPIPREEVSA